MPPTRRARYPPTGADRFVWHVDARCGDAAREAALADPEVQGPWRDLIDAVRAAQKAAGRPKRAADQRPNRPLRFFTGLRCFCR